MKSTKLTTLALAVALATPLFASATSDITTGAGALAASGTLDFRIIIPKFLFLQVGTGTFLVDNPAIDVVEFNVPLREPRRRPDRPDLAREHHRARRRKQRRDRPDGDDRRRDAQWRG